MWKFLTGVALGFARAIGEYGSVVIISSNIPFKDLIAPVLIFQRLEEYDYTGATVQYAKEPDDSIPLDKLGKKFIQEVTGVFLYLARAVDSTMLTPLSALASEQAAPTEKTAGIHPYGL